MTSIRVCRLRHFYNIGHDDDGYVQTMHYVHMMIIHSFPLTYWMSNPKTVAY